MKTSASIYKILRAAEYGAAEADPVYPGSPDDLRDGFIHFSTLEQLSQTTEKYFRGEMATIILAFPADTFSKDSLKWEPSRGGALFPHLYGPLDVSQAIARWTYDVPTDGAVNLSFITDTHHA